ncbi:MAG: hypothetical protein ACE37K_24805 [Planctomycetota bacterium]|jgi:hypothetical protein
MIRPRRSLARLSALLLVFAAATSCSFIADEFVKLDTPGPVAQPPAPPSALQDRP